MILNNCVTLAHEYVKKITNENTIAIDATAGNGNDAVFLGENCKKVYAFDIQEEAINNTKVKLEKNNIKNVILIKDSHENIDLHIAEKVDVVMFNLGYLPKSNHHITTQYTSTIKALSKSMNMLNEKGIITIVIYYGQDNEEQEKIKLLEYIKTIDEKKYKVLKLSYENISDWPPILVIIEKKLIN